MPTPSSGPISLDDLQTEFGGSNPISLSEYYKADVDVPPNGEISLSDLRDKSAHARRNLCVTAFNAGVGTAASQAYRGPLFDVLGFIESASLQGTFEFSPTSLNATTHKNALDTTQNTVIVAYSSGTAGIKVPSLNIFGTTVPSTSFTVNRQTGSYGVVSYVMPDKFPSNTLKRLKNLTNNIVWNSAISSTDNVWGGIYACMILPNRWAVSNILTTTAAEGDEATVTMDPNDFLIVCFRWTGQDWDAGYYASGIQSHHPAPDYKLLDGATGTSPGGVRATTGKTVTAFGSGANSGLRATSHGFALGDPIKFTTTGTLPAPLNPNEVFYVSEIINANDFRVKLSSHPNASSLVITNSGTGTHTVYDYTPGESLAPYLAVAGKWFQSGGVLIYRNSSTATKTYRIPTRMDWVTGYALEIPRMAQLVTFAGNGYLNSTNS